MNYLNILFFVLVCSQAFGLQIDNEGESHRKLVEEIDIYFDQAEISLHDNPEGTLESARESANKILDVQDGALRGHFYYRFAGLYLDLFQLDSAMYFYSISKENLESVSQNTEALGTLAKVWHNLGLIYQLNGDYDVYLDYIINHAIPIQEKIGDKRTMAKNLVGIAIVLHNLKDYEKAVTYFNMALEIAKELDDFEDTADIYLRIFHAEVGWNQDQNKKMLSSLLDKVGSLLEGMSPNYRHILLYEAKGLFEEISDDDNAAALKYYNEGIDLAVDLNEKRLELELLNRTFYLLMELKRYSDVEQVFDQIEAHSKYLSRGDKILILNNKADFLAAIGKPAEALEVLKSTISLKDSISKNRADLKAFELEMQYNSKVKENLILQLENENQKALLKLGKRRLMIFYLIFLFFYQ